MYSWIALFLKNKIKIVDDNQKNFQLTQSFNIFFPYYLVLKVREREKGSLKVREVWSSRASKESGREEKKMEDSSAILCQISSLKDMLDQVYLYIYIHVLSFFILLSYFSFFR